jgi:prepilin-type N-terminal cleavage/methylation domain-containing protein
MDSALRTTRREGQSSAFTLVELLVVISLIGVLMFIAVPAFKGFGSSATTWASRVSRPSRTAPRSTWCSSSPRMG